MLNAALLTMELVLNATQPRQQLSVRLPQILANVPLPEHAQPIVPNAYGTFRLVLLCVCSVLLTSSLHQLAPAYL